MFIIIFSIIIKCTSYGPVLFWSKRVGKNDIIFDMPKFRTMQIGAPLVATDKLFNSKKFITKFGSFLRKSS